MEKDSFVGTCKDFHKTIQDHQKKDESHMKKTYDRYVRELQAMQEKTDDMYKNLLQWMIEHVKHDDGHALLIAMQNMMEDIRKTPSNMETYAEVLQDTKKMLDAGKRAHVKVVEDERQFPFGKKPMYFDFLD